MANERYFSRSFALLKCDRGWIKPILALTAAGFVPVVGALGLRGYSMEWARLVAWGVDAAPKQKNVKVGECIKAGWRAFVALVVPVAVVALAGRLLAELASATGLGGLDLLMDVVITAAQVLAGIVGAICALHATIYQDIKAGFSYRRIVSLVRADFGGVVRLCVLDMALSLVVGLVVGIAMSALFGVALSDVLSHYQMWAYDDVLAQVTWSEMFNFMADLMSQLGSFALPFALVVLLGNVCLVFARLILTTAVGLWMRKFDVPHWGPADQPIAPHPRPAQLPYAGMPTGR